jgi:hypothetical protein
VHPVKGAKQWYYHGKFIPVKSTKQFKRWLKLQALW